MKGRNQKRHKPGMYVSRRTSNRLQADVVADEQLEAENPTISIRPRKKTNKGKARDNANFKPKEKVSDYQSQ